MLSMLLDCLRGLTIMLACSNAVSNADSVPSALLVTIDHILLLSNTSQCSNQNGQSPEIHEVDG